MSGALTVSASGKRGLLQELPADLLR